jgi:hypothetical protein
VWSRLSSWSVQSPVEVAARRDPIRTRGGRSA